MDVHKDETVTPKFNVHSLLTACTNREDNPASSHKMYRDLHTMKPETCNSDLSEKLQNIQDDKYPKLTIGMFFEFMRTAYQVNDNSEGLATMLTANSEIDWSKLAKISLDLEAFADKNVISNIEHINGPQEVRNINHTEKASNDMSDSKDIGSPNVETICDTRYNDLKLLDTNVYEQSQNYTNSTIKIKDENDMQNKEVKRVSVEQGNQLLEIRSYNKKTKGSQYKGVEEKECVLAEVMKRSLSDILHEGLLDSVLPYMLPKPVQSQPIIKKSALSTDVKKSVSLNNNVENKIVSTAPAHKERDKDKNRATKKSLENEVEIHVCDEDKKIKKNFRCPQKLLIQKMCYFADVTAGQKLEEIDISVHCDIVIFDWLMRWVKKDIIKKSEWPVLEATNVIPIMVSASFLQMEPLLESCLQYCHSYMSDILRTSTILTCLDDTLLTRLAELFTNEDVEILKDKKDKIQSRLFCKLILSLAETVPNNKRGHYGSLATLFKCGKCGKHVIQSTSDLVPCISSAMKIDSKGTVHSKHMRDLTWTLNDYIMNLRSELRSWRKVYWRLWGDCHFLFCQQCQTSFPIHQMDWCCYHPETPQFFVNEQQRPMPFPLGRYPCCSQRAYRFEALTSREGCRYKGHAPDIVTEKDVNVLNIFAAHKDIISVEPPQLFFPEKITRLVAPDPSLRPGKLICKETMWWHGIEIVPPRPKLGLLGKIWSGSGFRRSAQAQDYQKSSQKLRRQVSLTTDVSSPSTSITDSEEDDADTGCESSLEEDSYYSDDSNIWPSSKTVNKLKKKSGNQIIQKHNGRRWNVNLIIRYNQDNQREFEEKATMQMMSLLTKRTSAECSMFLKSYKQHSANWKNNQLIGGTYTKLEAQFRDQLTQSYKHKNSVGTKSARVKSYKL